MPIKRDARIVIKRTPSQSPQKQESESDHSNELGDDLEGDVACNVNLFRVKASH